MAKVELDQVKTLPEYEKTREAFRHFIIAARNRRRVPVGDRVSLAFENHDTVLFQVQEMIRAERITAPPRIADEVETYNALLGDGTTLAATLFIEITDRDRIKEELDKFQGLDRDRRLYMEFGDRPPVVAVFEEGHSTDERISAVHYVRFPLGVEAAREFMDSKQPVRVVIDHPYYRAHTELSEDTRFALASDLMSR